MPIIIVLQLEITTTRATNKTFEIFIKAGRLQETSPLKILNDICSNFRSEAANWQAKETLSRIQTGLIQTLSLSMTMANIHMRNKWTSQN